MPGIEDWKPLADPLGFERLVLLVDWDPTGVFGIPEAMDEYDRYAPATLALLQRGASDDEIAAHLRCIESEDTGVRGHPDLASVVARLRDVLP